MMLPAMGRRSDASGLSITAAGAPQGQLPGQLQSARHSLTGLPSGALAVGPPPPLQVRLPQGSAPAVMPKAPSAPRPPHGGKAVPTTVAPPPSFAALVGPPGPAQASTATVSSTYLGFVHMGAVNVAHGAASAPGTTSTQRSSSALRAMTPSSSTAALSTASTPRVYNRAPGGWDDEDDEMTSRLWELCRRIDTDRDGFISELELISAVQLDPEIASYVLPGVDINAIMHDERCFDEIDAVFETLAAGKKRIKCLHLIEHLRDKMLSRTPGSADARDLFKLIGTDQDGYVSKLQLVSAVQRHASVANFVLPRMNCSNAMVDVEVFDAVITTFNAISAGKRRFSFADFDRHYCRLAVQKPRPSPKFDRRSVRLFIIGPGFGLKLNPRQAASITSAGFQVHWCHDLPNPERPDFPVQPYLDQLRKQIAEFQPDVVVAASKGGVYVTGLWWAGYWRGPTLLLNAHPSCTQVPEEVSLVLAHGSNDEVYPTPREKLEHIISTGKRNRCFLYHTANSGQLTTGHLSRTGDRHNMESLLKCDLLPRLVDATVCPEGPEVHIVRSWRERLSEDRLEAEAWLGYTPEQLCRHWVSSHRGGSGTPTLFEVPRSSEEFWQVNEVFHAMPREPPAYMLSPPAAWDKVEIVRLQRVENHQQVEGSTKPYHASLNASLEEQGVRFELGTHTSWAFHGTDHAALESIVSDPVAGFQPLASGSRGASLWGLGTYFAREAKYVADGGFCGPPAADGMRRMLMCLLSTGLPCLGDPLHKGVLPFRQRPHRYHSSVDSLSSPEVYIVQHAGAAQPAYLITFA